MAHPAKNKDDSGAVEEVSEEENLRIIEEEKQAYMERKKNEESGNEQEMK